MRKETVGFIGLGIMGQAMAVNVLKGGWPLLVWNRSPGPAEALAAKGALVAGSPRELARKADVTICMLTGNEALSEVLFGENGLAEVLGPGKTLLNMSTIAPALAEEFSARLAAKGADYLDCPVSGSKKPAEEGTLIVLAGGKADVVAAREPLLLSMAQKVIHCGPAGKGSLMKMSVNLLLSVMNAGLAEAVSFGAAGGLAVGTMLEVILSGPLACGLFKLKAPMLEAGAFPTQFPLKHMAKDLKYVSDTAYAQKTPVPLALSALTLYTAGLAQGCGDEDFAAVAKVLGLLAGRE